MLRQVCPSRQPAKRRPPDRRKAVRFLPPQEVVCYARRRPEENFVRARVCDLSAGGTCLLMGGPVQVGDTLDVELINWPHTFLCCRNLLVLRVFHSSDGCVVAGEFDRKLSIEDLKPFLL